MAIQSDLASFNDVQSTTATPVTLVSYAGPGGSFPSNCFVQCFAEVVINDTTGALRDAFIVRAIFHNVGGTLTLVASSNTTIANKATATVATAPQFTASGSNIVLASAQGNNATIVWCGFVRYVIGT